MRRSLAFRFRRSAIWFREERAPPRLRTGGEDAGTQDQLRAGKDHRAAQTGERITANDGSVPGEFAQGGTERCRGLPGLERNLAEQGKEEEMTLELLYLAGCPNHEATVELVQRVLGAEGMAVEVRQTLICNHEEANATAFPGRLRCG